MWEIGGTGRGGHHKAIRNADQVEPRRANATAWQDNLYAADAENEFCFRLSRFSPCINWRMTDEAPLVANLPKSMWQQLDYHADWQAASWGS